MREMAFTRRQFLQSTAASALIVPLAARRVLGQVQSDRFRHGVASGDPLADRVVLWTRLTPSEPVAASVDLLDVRWVVASDPDIRRIIASGTAHTSADRDFTVKVDVMGLEPARPYFYAFEYGFERSPVGRTRTLPSGAVPRARLAVVSCANYPAGYFNVYRCIADRDDLDAVLHLGDYIYEFENGEFGDGSATGRVPDPPREAVTLSDYRRRYASYRTDPDLQEVHRRHPFIAVWDDHESANDAWRGGAVNHNPERGEGDWETRRAAAARAYLEWMPVRETEAGAFHLYRSFPFGELADLTMLDTRSMRDRQAARTDVAALTDRNRTLMGLEQESWLFQELRRSQRDGTRWRLIGQQIMFSPLTPAGRAVQNADVWDGYQAARGRVFDAIEENTISDVVVLTGDIHSSWALDVPRNPWSGYRPGTGEGSLAVELVTPAVSSPPLFADSLARERAAALKVALPHLKFLDGDRRGYLLLEISSDRIQADWYLVPDVIERSTMEARAKTLVCERGSSHLVPA